MERGGKHKFTLLSETLLVTESFQGKESLFSIQVWLLVGLLWSSGWTHNTAATQWACEKLRIQSWVGTEQWVDLKERGEG